MRIEKHNAHGLQLCVSMSEAEGHVFLRDLASALSAAHLSGVSRYIHFDVLFEDDNDKWESTSFDVTIVTGSPQEPQPG